MPRPAATQPASEHLKSEPAIVAGMARATLGERSVVDWESLVADYDLIRDAIEAVFPIFQGYNARIRVPGGFHLTSTARERIWTTPTGKANFLVFDGLGEDPDADDPDVLWLTSVRSHDQYNTTLYSLSDRYRGVFGQRDVLFISPEEIEKRGFKPDDRVDLVTVSLTAWSGVVRNFELVSYAVPGAELRGLLPGDQSARAALCPRPDELHAVLQGHSDPDRGGALRSGGGLTMDACRSRATAVRLHHRLPHPVADLHHRHRLLRGAVERPVVAHRPAGLSRPDALLAQHLRTRLRHGRHHRRRAELRDRRQLGRLLALGGERARPALHVRGADRLLPRSGLHRHRAVR